MTTSTIIQQATQTTTRTTTRNSKQQRRRFIERETRRKLFLETLEDRRLLAGLKDWAPELLLNRLDITTPAYGPQPLPTAIDTTIIAGSWTLPRDESALPVRRELVVVDGGVQDYQQLLNDLGRGSLVRSREVEAILIDTSVDGIDALTKVLEQVKDLRAIHIVSHGGPGMLKLGNVTLTAENLDQYAEQIGSWKSALLDGADLMLYGCDLASNEAGRQFIDSLQELTGADVAASYDTTGDLRRGNDWELEYETGPIDTQTAFSEALQQSYSGTMVNQTFPAGSYIVDMGVSGLSMTAGNQLKPFGLVYDLVTNFKIPVAWAITANKDFAFDTGDADVGGVWADPDGVVPANSVDFNVATVTSPGGKDFRGGAFIINENYLTPAIVTAINNWKAQGVVVEQTTASLTTNVFGNIGSFPRAVLDLQNGGIVAGYYPSAGIPSTSYALGTPLDLNSCYDVYVAPHSDPQSWPDSYRNNLVNFIDNQQGGLWAACHSVSAYEDNFPFSQNMKFLSTGLIEWGSHDDGTASYYYNESSENPNNTNIADDPIMQVMNRFDGALKAGSEQIYIPVAGQQWRPETTVAVLDPNQPDRIITSTNQIQTAAALVAYGYAYGDPTNGFIMYEAGHRQTGGTAQEYLSAQRAYFNFLVLQGVLHAPNLNVTLPTIVAGQNATLSATITGGSGTYTYQWVSYNGSTFSTPTGSATAGVPITTDFLLSVPNDTIKLLVTDSCGRRNVYAVEVSDTPPTLSPDFTGCFQTNGVLVPAIGPITITDGGTTLASAAIRLTNRPDGAAEQLVINQSLANSYGITVTSDGAGGFNLTGTATHAQYDAVLESLQYANTDADPTLVNRIITVTINDGASNSTALTSTLRPPTTGAFTGSLGGSAVTTYYENSTIFLSINDQPANSNPNSVNSFTMTLTSSGGDSETVTLTETGINTGIFTGSIASSTVASGANSGTLTAVAGNTLSTSHVSAGGCNTWIGTASILAPDFEQKQLYFTPTLGMDRVDPVTTNDTSTSTQAMNAPLGGANMNGTLVYTNNVAAAVNYRKWDSESFSAATTQTGLSNADVLSMAGASAPNRNEKIVIMANNDNPDSVNAMRWNGTTWTLLTRETLGIGGTGVAIGTSVQGEYAPADVAYEQLSGRAIMVWDDNGTLRYSYSSDGTAWTSSTVSGISNTARQIRLAADPNSNRLIMVVNYQNELDAAYVWDTANNTWGDELILDGNTTHDRTDINVIFEGKSGDAMVVYATGTTGSVGYYTYSGGAWGASGSLAPPPVGVPTDADGYARWTTLAADPTSDRIVLGVQTYGTGSGQTGDVWMRVWNGSSWGTATLAASNTATTAATTTTSSIVYGNDGVGVAVGFESRANAHSG